MTVWVPRTAIRDMARRRYPTVMAGLVPAIHRGTVLVGMAGTSPAKTMGGDTARPK